MGFALGIHAMGGNLAAAAGPAIVGVVLAWVTWRTVFAFQFLPGIATALFLWLLLPRLGHAPREAQSGSYGRVVARSSPSFQILDLVGFRLPVDHDDRIFAHVERRIFSVPEHVYPDNGLTA